MDLGPEPASRTLEAEGVEALPAGLWERLRAEPERAPELLALAAAERFAPAAERWAETMSQHHSPAEMAAEARRKHVRLSALEGAALGLGGAATAAADVVALAWIQSRMVFLVAASYGFEPRHPMRPAELLALQGLYATPSEARAGLDGTGTPLAVAAIEGRLAGGGDPLSRRLLKLVGRRIAKRGALRVIPLVASPVNALQNRSATADLGARAIRYYGGDQARP